MVASVASIIGEGCSPSASIYKSTIENNSMMIPLSEFMERNYVIARSNKLDYDIFIHKNSKEEYTAVMMRCSHRDAPLQYTTGGLVCHEHGSRFSYDGVVTKEPASTPLKKFPVTIDQTHLIINIKA